MTDATGNIGCPFLIAGVLAVIGLLSLCIGAVVLVVRILR